MNEFDKIFEGLKPAQAEEIKRRILPTAQELREKILSGEIEVDETFDYSNETDPAKVRKANKERRPAKGLPLVHPDGRSTAR